MKIASEKKKNKNKIKLNNKTQQVFFFGKIQNFNFDRKPFTLICPFSEKKNKKNKKRNMRIL